MSGFPANQAVKSSGHTSLAMIPASGLATCPVGSSRVMSDEWMTEFGATLV